MKSTHDISLSVKIGWWSLWSLCVASDLLHLSLSPCEERVIHEVRRRDSLPACPPARPPACLPASQLALPVLTSTIKQCETTN